VSSAARALCDSAPAHQARLRRLDTGRLAQLLARTTIEADLAKIDDREYLLALGLDGGAPAAGEVWRTLVDRHMVSEPDAPEHLPALEVMLEEGCLARRLLRRAGRRPGRDALAALYLELCDCLREGRLFRGAG
jgi:carboxylate-amine ligase